MEEESASPIPVPQERLWNKYCWDYPSYAWTGLQEKEILENRRDGFTNGKSHPNNLTAVYDLPQQTKGEQ